MKKQILYILFLLPAIFLFEKGFCQNKQSDIKVLSLEKTMNTNGKLQAKKRILSEHQWVSVITGDNLQIRGRITHTTDSTIIIRKRKDIKINDIKEISCYHGPLIAVGVGLIVVGVGIIMYSSSRIYLPFFGTGLFTFFIGNIITSAGIIDQVTKKHYSMHKGWKINVITAPTKPRPVYIIK